MKFNIGDKAYIVISGSVERFAMCPCCCGDKYVTIIYGDQSRATIPCGECGPGYNDPTGNVRYYEYKPDILHREIIGIERKEDGYSYNLGNGPSSWYPRAENEVFATKEEAEAASLAMIAEQNERELQRIKTRTKEGRSWSFNATYHRNKIRELTKEIEYHKKKQAWAEEVAKTKDPRP